MPEVLYASVLLFVFVFFCVFCYFFCVLSSKSTTLLTTHELMILNSNLIEM